MALSVESALKAVLEAAALGVPVFNELPQGNAEAKRPYIVVHPPYASPTDPTAAPAAKNGRKGVRSEVQIDIWQEKRAKATGSDRRDRVFDPLLPELVAAAVDGVDFSGIPLPSRYYGCHLIDGPRGMPQPMASNTAHHVVTVRVDRNLVTVRP